ncbi:ATP-binding cassette domain-containing protein [Lactonifactor sp. BIOML-A3]|nr:ATP-binding cassette domain-containing protein [Lactonifactor sp. BIOML-A5]MSA07790.1 ATP-binding cassette domain-containing protein [Lactonifactor sp. BIOML-A4]MSA11986.1 ATP-binding cassette domain-containing protein [Lactonifactor sp. BIOML-A3]MSA16426.1 ATP-binding cassette domain-containing protein [Lactonifactor sp. BIOML-A2]MSA37030.1 ATP-binding cassette domain-containing protein [Lactonifactor sp. BIOML-A1]MSB13068.1 ATP-binding cassette domain-containing protein [Lactonifactor sp.
MEQGKGLHDMGKMPSMGRGHVGGARRFSSSAKPQNAKGTLKRILGIYLKWGRAIFAAVVLTALASVITVLLPYFTGRAFDAFQAQTRTVQRDLLETALFIMGSLYAANWLITTANGLCMLKVTQKLVFALRSEYFSKLQKLPLTFYDTRSHGDTMSRLTNDIDNISSTIAQATTQLISGVLTLTGSLVVMISLNLPLTGVVLLCVPLVAGLTKLIAGRSRSYFLRQQQSLGTLNGLIEENIRGLKMVKAFGRQEDVLEEFSVLNGQLFENSRKAQTWSGFLMPLMNVINNLIFTLVAIAGGIGTVSYGLSIGTVISFLTYSKHFAQPLNSVAGMFNTIQAALAGAERVFEILDEREETPDPPDAAVLEHPAGEVAFCNVDFSYEQGRKVLEDVSFQVHAGEVVALVGETGAGKTTLVNLLTRFYDPDRGRILIDGVDTVTITRRSLRDCFSVVLQDTCLFTGTIMDNIRYSRPQAGDEEVIKAARMACAHEFITRLPKGYQTEVSGSTDTLSQGQRQLLAIARAVLCQAPILILDEATSSVDTRTEKSIQRALVTLMEGHTSFLIAHRLSTIRDADKIMVIGDGRIQETGTHEELMRKKGVYYRMVAGQMGQEV